MVILDFDDDKSKIQLGLKQLTDHPWDKLGDDVKEGSKVSGKVVVIADYGAFIEIDEGIEGLVHVSEMSWSTHLRSAQDFVNVGDNIEAVVLSLDRESRKMSLGMKQLSEDGISINVVSSDLEEVVGLSHRMLILSRGVQKNILTNSDNISRVEIMKQASN